MHRVVWSLENVSIFLCAWHALKAWRLWSMEKIKDKEWFGINNIHGFTNFKELGIIDIGGLMTMNVNIFNTNDTSYIINELESSSAPMEKTLFQLQDEIQEITNECKGGGGQLCHHATSLLKIVALYIRNIRLTQTNESLHPCHCLSLCG
jgi:hypothetical protein